MEAIQENIRLARYHLHQYLRATMMMARGVVGNNASMYQNN
jgi:hypothetical protein